MSSSLRSLRRSVSARAHPANAARYVVGRSPTAARGSDRTAGILWIVLLIVVLKAVRDGQWPNPAQAAAIVAGAFALILVGEVAPDLVLWSLVALLVAALLVDIPELGTAIDAAQRAVDALAHFGPPLPPGAPSQT